MSETGPPHDLDELLRRNRQILASSLREHLSRSPGELSLTEFLAGQRRGWSEEELRRLDRSGYAAHLQYLSWRAEPPGLETVVRKALGHLRQFEKWAAEKHETEVRGQEDCNDALRAELRAMLGDFEGRRRQQQGDLVRLQDEAEAALRAWRDPVRRPELGLDGPTWEDVEALRAKATAIRLVIERGFEDRARLESEYSVLVAELACQRPALPLTAVISSWADEWVRRWRAAGAGDEEILTLARAAFSDAYRSAPQLQSFGLDSAGGGRARVTIPGGRVTLPGSCDGDRGLIHLATSDRRWDGERLEVAFASRKKCLAVPVGAWKVCSKSHSLAKSAAEVSHSELVRELGEDWGVVCAPVPPA
jgi:hypothetical protein